MPDDRASRRRQCALEVVGGRERRPCAKQRDDAGDERCRDGGRATDSGAAAERRDRRAIGRGELHPLAVARERRTLSRGRRGRDGDRLGEGCGELGSRARLVPGRGDDENASRASADDCVPQDLGRPLAVDARVHDGRAVVDGVVDRRGGVHVQRDAVRAEHAQRHDAATEAGPDAAEAVVRAGRGRSRDGRPVPVARGIRCVGVVVDEVVARREPRPRGRGATGRRRSRRPRSRPRRAPVVTSQAAGSRSAAYAGCVPCGSEGTSAEAAPTSAADGDACERREPDEPSCHR